MKEDSIEYIQKLNNLKKDNKSEKKIFRLEKDGKKYWVKSEVLPLFNEENEFLGDASIQLDITKCKELEKLSITDELTDLYNRRFFNNTLTREIKRALRDKTLLSFIMIDIDYFKKYNDSHGHDAGDKALTAVASTIKNSINRGGDFAFRLGGEEFGVLFTNTNIDNSLFLAEKIRKNIDDLNIEHPSSLVTNHITISLGLLVVDFSKDSVDENGFYTMADDALYQAKNEGRNQVVLYKNDDLDFF